MNKKYIKNIFMIYTFLTISIFANTGSVYYPEKNWIKKEPQHMNWSKSKFNKAKQYFEKYGIYSIYGYR